MRTRYPENGPEGRFVFWITHPIHLRLIRLFFGELNKIPSEDARIFALMYCGSISMKYPKLEMVVVGTTIFAGGLLGMLLNSPLVGAPPSPLFFLGGLLGGLFPIVLWYIRAIFRTRKFIPEGLEELGCQMCPICGWYFNEEVECVCTESKTKKAVE